MANRRVSVELELLAARYISAANELVAVTRAVKAAVDDLGDEADDTGRDLDQLAANSVVAAHEIDDLGDEARGSARDLALLDARIKATELSLRKLRVQAARSGDADVRQALSREESALREMLKLRKELSDLDSPDEPGRDRSFMSRMRLPKIDFSNFVSEGRGILITSLIGIIVAASPMIGAMLAGAVTTAIGGAGIAGGILSAIKNPQVRSAASEFGKSISELFFSGGQSWVIVQSLVDALSILKAGFRDLDLTGSFEIVAPYIEVFAKALADAGRTFMPEFNAALSAGRPVLTMFARDLPMVAGAFGQMFREMAQSKGAIMGMHFLMNMLANTFVLIGKTVGGLGNAFHWLVRRADALSVALADMIPDWWPNLWEKLHSHLGRFIHESDVAAVTSADLARVQQALAAELTRTADETAKLIGEYEDLYRIEHDLITGNIGFEQALDDLTAAIDENGNTLDAHTQKGRDNQRAVLAGVDAAKAMRDAMMESGVNTATANAIFQDNIETVVQQATKYGLSEQAVRDFIAELAKVPPVTEAMLRLQFETSGTLLGENSGLRRSELSGSGTILSIPDPISGTPGALTVRVEGRRAAGGAVLANRWYEVNEQQREFFRPNVGGEVLPLGRMSPDAGGPLIVENHIEVGGEVVRVVRTEITERERNTKRQVQGRFRRSSIQERT